MAITAGLSTQWKLNILAGTPGENRSILDCLNTLNGANDASKQDAFNRWAGTTGLRKREAMLVRARNEVVFNVNEGRSTQSLVNFV